MVAMSTKAEATPFGRRIREIRMNLGLTQTEVAEKVGMKTIVLSRLETSPKANPTWDTICRLAQALEMTPYDLVAGIQLGDE